ncbi:unnamed protein product, partial [Prorocentrum cordatum]
LQRCDQRVRERRAVAAGSVAARRHVGDEDRGRHHLQLVIYSAAISACEKGGQWQQALSLIVGMWELKLEPDTIFSCNAEIRAYDKCGQWQQALSLLGEMRESSLEPNENQYSLVITVYERLSRHSAGFPGDPQIGLSRFRLPCEALCVWDPAGPPP